MGRASFPHFEHGVTATSRSLSLSYPCILLSSFPSSISSLCLSLPRSSQAPCSRVRRRVRSARAQRYQCVNIVCVYVYRTIRYSRTQHIPTAHLSHVCIRACRAHCVLCLPLDSSRPSRRPRHGAYARDACYGNSRAISHGSNVVNHTEVGRSLPVSTLSMSRMSERRR